MGSEVSQNAGADKDSRRPMWVLWGLLWRATALGCVWLAATAVCVAAWATHDLTLEGFGLAVRVGLFGTAFLVLVCESVLVRWNVALMEGAFPEDEAHPGRLVVGWSEVWVPALGFIVALTFALVRHGDTAERLWYGSAAGPVFAVGLAAASSTAIAVALLRWWRMVTWTARERNLRGKAWWRDVERPALWTTFPEVTLVAGLLALWVSVFSLPGLAGDDLVWAGMEVRVAKLRSLDAPEYLVELGADDDPAEILDVVFKHDGALERVFKDGDWARDPDLGHTYVVHVPQAQAKALVDALTGDTDTVDRVELNSALPELEGGVSAACVAGYGRGTFNDPYARGDGSLEAMGVGPWLAQVGSRGPTRLAIVDNGVDGSHEDLRGVVWRVGQARGRPHGTAMAGAAAAVANNERGVASPNVGGRLVQVLDVPELAGDDSSADDVARALGMAARHGARVVSLSFGLRQAPPKVLEDAVRRLREQDVLVVASAGNGGPWASAGSQWPANVPGVLVVGASDARQGSPEPWHRSSRLSGVTAAVWAPGVGVCVPSSGGGYVQEDGTSVAAARVAGALAALRSLCPGTSAEQWMAAVRHQGHFDARQVWQRVQATRDCR